MNTKIAIYEEKKFTRVHISRKCVRVRRNPGTKAMISIDHGFNWEEKDHECRLGDVVLFQNYALKEGEEIWSNIGYIYGRDELLRNLEDTLLTEMNKFGVGKLYARCIFVGGWAETFYGLEAHEARDMYYECPNGYCESCKIFGRAKGEHRLEVNFTNILKPFLVFP